MCTPKLHLPGSEPTPPAPSLLIPQLSHFSIGQIGTTSPDEVLNLEFMQPRGISQNALARTMKVSPRRVNLIVHGQRNITADTAIRMSMVLGTPARLWLDLQAAHDLEQATHAFQDVLSQLL